MVKTRQVRAGCRTLRVRLETLNEVDDHPPTARETGHPLAVSELRTVRAKGQQMKIPE